METAMKITLLTLVLLLLTGSGEPQAVTQAAASLQQTPKAKPQRVTPSEFTGKVIKVVDGDTIDVLTDDKEKIRIRFSGIDTPERGQPYGNNATRLQCSQSMSVSVTNGCSGARC